MSNVLSRTLESSCFSFEGRSEHRLGDPFNKDAGGPRPRTWETAEETPEETARKRPRKPLRRVSVLLSPLITFVRRAHLKPRLNTTLNAIPNAD